MAEHTIRPANQNLTSDLVAEYLAENPNFLNDYPDLLNVLKPPSRELGEGVSDLQHTMIDRLRDKVERTEDLAHVMITNSRDNLTSTTQIHECVLKLMSAESFEDLLDVINTDLAVILQLDCVALCIEQSETEMMPIKGIRQIPPTLIDHLIPENRTIVLRDKIMADPNVYVEAVGLIQSEALVRLDISPEVPSALIAFGSREEDRFDPSQATELILFMAQAMSELIRIWLALPSPETIFEGQEE